MLGNLRGRLAMMAGLAESLFPTGPVEFRRTTEVYRRYGIFDYAAWAPMTYGTKGAGIGMAQQQRASRKAKNVKRARAAGRA